jgi:Fur family ferric uptake transcriptional regulator
MSHDSLNLAALLRREGYRMTMQRQLVLDAVCEAGGHAAPEQIYEIVRRSSEAVNRTTVYRTLQLLQELKVIDAVHSNGGHLRYEISGPQPHHHLVCRCCGADVEFSHEMFVPFLERINEAHGFIVDTSHLTLQGQCERCFQGRGQ